MPPYSPVLLVLAAVAARTGPAAAPIRPSLALFAQETKVGPAAKAKGTDRKGRAQAPQDKPDDKPDDKQDDKQAAAAVCRPALVAIARQDGAAAESGAAATKMFQVAYGPDWLVESEKPMDKPALVLLIDPNWSPCLGTATRLVNLRSRAEKDTRVEAMVVEGCPSPPDASAVTAIEGVSDAEVSAIAGPGDAKRKVDWFAIRDLKHLNRLARSCAAPVKPFDVKQQVVPRKHAVVHAALMAAKRHRDLDGLQAKLLVTRGKRRYVIFASDDHNKPVKVVAVAGRRAAVAGTWPDLWPH